jgi:EmrB/QacA subfamily drug resistance transporter
MTSTRYERGVVSAATRQRRALGLLVTIQFLLILDAAIVGIALPSIQAQLGFSPAGLSWVTNGYTLAFGGFLLLGGRVGDLLEQRRVFVAGVLLFTCASAVAAVAPDPAMLVTARLVQGFSAAIASPIALSLLLHLFPDATAEGGAARARALGIWSAVGGAGGAAGFILGGVLTDYLGWRSVFLINVPVGLVVAILSPRLLPRPRRAATRGAFDLAGASAITGGLVALVYALISAGERGLLATMTWAAALVAVLLLVAFVVVERSSSTPLVPLSVFRRPAIRGSNLLMLLVTAAFTPTFFFLSLTAQRVFGFSPMLAGLALLPLALIIVATAINAGKLLTRFGPRVVAATGLMSVGSGLFWLAFVSGHHFALEVLGPEVLVGVGGGLTFVAVTVVGTAGIDAETAGLATGLLSTSQQIGASIGLATLAAISDAVLVAGDGADATNHAQLAHAYDVTFLVAACIALLSVCAAGALLPRNSKRLTRQSPTSNPSDCD